MITAIMMAARESALAEIDVVCREYMSSQLVSISRVSTNGMFLSLSVKAGKISNWTVMKMQLGVGISSD